MRPRVTDSIGRLHRRASSEAAIAGGDGDEASLGSQPQTVGKSTEKPKLDHRFRCSVAGIKFRPFD